MNVKMTFLGTGTSQGVPIIGCDCKVCRSGDPRDSRLRSSALFECGGRNILIDAGTDFRTQMLRAGVHHLDAILLTHNHKDHTGGLDDTRALEYTDGWKAQIYCEPKVLETLKVEYDYVFFDKKYPGAPAWDIHIIDENPFEVGGVRIIPIRGFHGKMPILGFRIGDIAYLTDMSRIPESEMGKLKGLKHLTLNTVCYHPHYSHFCLEEALGAARAIGAENTWLTHLSHNFPPHAEFALELPEGVRPAYDNLVIND